jgi:hypothetical protein
MNPEETTAPKAVDAMGMLNDGEGLKPETLKPETRFVAPPPMSGMSYADRKLREEMICRLDTVLNKLREDPTGATLTEQEKFAACYASGVPMQSHPTPDGNITFTTAMDCAVILNNDKIQVVVRDRERNSTSDNQETP